MQTTSVEKSLLWIAKIGVWLALFTPVIVSGGLFFPYVSGKNFFFRIVVEILFGAWLGLAVLNRSYLPRRSVFLVISGIFLAVVILASMFGVDPYYSFWSNYERMEGLITYLHLAALFVVASAVFRTEKEWTTVFHFSIGVSLIIALYGFFEKVGIITPGGSVAGSAGAGRIFATLGNPIYLAVYMMFHLFVLALLFVRSKSPAARAAYFAIALFEFYIFIAAGTRGAMLGLAGGAAVTLVMLILFSKNRLIRLSGTGILALAGILVAIFIQVKDGPFVTSHPVLRRLADISLSSSTAESRFAIWNMAWQAFKERPLLGWGPGNFIIPYAKYYNPNLYGNEPWFDRVHNMPLEWLMSTGVIGFSLYAAMFLAAMYLCWQAWKRGVISTEASAILLGLLVAYHIQNIFVFDTITTYLLLMVVFAYIQSAGTFFGQATVATPPAYSPNRAFPAMICLIGGVVAAVALNAKPMSVAAGIISSLDLAGQNATVAQVVARFDQTLAKGSFGRTEGRERLADLAIQVSAQAQNLPSEQYILLLTRGIEEMKKQAEFQPAQVKYQITLGKLLQIRFSLTKSAQDRDESIAAYKKGIETAPSYPTSYVGLAETYLTAGNPQEAVKTINAINDKITKPTPLFYSALLVSVFAGDFDTGIHQMGAYLDFAKLPEYQKGGVFFETERMQEVIRRSLAGGNPAGRERFLKAISRGLQNPEDPILLMALAETAVDLGKPQEAREYADRALKVAPEYKDQIESFFKNLQTAPVDSKDV